MKMEFAARFATSHLTVIYQEQVESSELLSPQQQFRKPPRVAILDETVEFRKQFFWKRKNFAAKF